MIFNSILYVQLEGFAALVLFIIMDHGKNRLMNLSQRLFKLQLCLTIAVLLLDAATWVLNGRIFPGAHTICLAVNQLYWFLSILPCYVGFLYCVSMRKRLRHSPISPRSASLSSSTRERPSASRTRC